MMMTAAHDIRFMQEAIEKARKGIVAGQTPFGACLVQGTRVIACEHNRVWKDQDVTAHAEIVALRRACRVLKTIDLSSCVLYSTCEPCPMCFSACHWARIPRIVYGASIRDAAQAEFHELHISNVRLRSLGQLGVDLVGGVLRKECRGLFSEWQNQAQCRPY